MNEWNSRKSFYATRVWFPVWILLVATLIVNAPLAFATSSGATKVPTTNRVDALALKWFDEMKSGQIDRTQLAPEYNAQLTDESVRQMSRYLKEHDYGVPPQRAEIAGTRTIGNQTLYVVKLIFPRGDATSLLFGFNADGKITGVSVLSLAGD